MLNSRDNSNKPPKDYVDDWEHRYNGDLQRLNKKQRYIDNHSKSQITGFILCLLFGPLGLFYSDKIVASILTGVAIVGSMTVLIPIMCWLFSFVASIKLISNHNDTIKDYADMYFI
jgi:hypothetical protein